MILSLDISHFEGVVTALLHSINANIFYNKKAKISDISNIIKDVEIAKKISNIVGCYYYNSIIDDLLRENNINI